MKKFFIIHFLFLGLVALDAHAQQFQRTVAAVYPVIASDPVESLGPVRAAAIRYIVSPASNAVSSGPATTRFAPSVPAKTTQLQVDHELMGPIRASAAKAAKTLPGTSEAEFVKFIKTLSAKNSDTSGDVESMKIVREQAKNGVKGLPGMSDAELTKFMKTLSAKSSDPSSDVESMKVVRDQAKNGVKGLPGMSDEQLGKFMKSLNARTFLKDNDEIEDMASIRAAALKAPTLGGRAPTSVAFSSDIDGVPDLFDISELDANLKDAIPASGGSAKGAGATFEFSPPTTSSSGLSLKNEDPYLKDYCACKIALPYNPSQNWAPVTFCVEKAKKLSESGMSKGKIRKETNVCKGSELKSWFKNEASAADSTCITKHQFVAPKDKPFMNAVEKMCHKKATDEEFSTLTSCYKDSEVAAASESDPKKKEKEKNKKFQACIVSSKLSDKYDIRSFGSILANEFSCVAGCEKFCEKKDKEPEPYKQCVVSRVGQEAAKAILAELVKEGGMVGALASVGMDVTSCIQPKGVTGVMTRASQFCDLLKPGMGSVPLSSQIIKACPSTVSRCDKYASGEETSPEMLYACGNSIINCMKSRPTTAAIEGCALKEFAELASKEYTKDRKNHDASFKQSLCIAGAAMSGLNALTSAYCADEKKFPTSAEKDDCLKKARFINEIGQAGASVAQCMQQGPKALSKEAQASLSDADKKDRDLMSKDRNICLTNKLGTQAVDLISDSLKLNESQRNFLMTGKDALARAQDCGRFKNPHTIDEHQAQKACWAAAGLDTAADLINGQDWIKDPTQRAIAAATLRAAGGMAQCGKSQTPKEKQNCLVQAGLAGLGQMPGAVGQVAKLAQSTQAIFGSMKDCKGQKDCVAGNLAKIIPGDAGVYAKFAVKAWTLLKEDTSCGIPSKYLFKASGLVGLTGDVVTKINHSIELKKLKKEFGSLVTEEAAKSEAGLFEGAAEVVRGNNAARGEERVEEAKDGQDIQIKAFAFQARNEEMVLKGQLITRPFYYTSAGLNAAGMTASIFESIAEKTVPTTAYWLPCVVKLKAKQGAASLKDVVTSNFETIHQDAIHQREELDLMIRGFKYGLINKNLPENDQKAFAHYMDIQKYIEGNLSSVSLNEFEMVKTMEGFDRESPLSTMLRTIVSNEFRAISDAEAFDLASVENIGTGMAQGLFPGKEGFEQGEPGAYAEQITYEIIKKGLDNLCQEKAKVDGSCHYTGKATIEMVAKRAAKLLLVKNKDETNKMMSEGTGRVLIAAYNAYGLMNTIKENEKMIDDQRNRVRNLQEIEKKMKANPDGETEKMTTSVDWNKLLGLRIIDDAIAAVPKGDPDLNLQVCLTKSAQIDYKCNCRSKGCFETIPFKDPNVARAQEGAMKSGKDAYKTAISSMNYPANIANQLLGGRLGAGEVDIPMLQANTQKLDRYNVALLKHLNGMLVSQRKAPLSLEASVQKQDAFILASLDPNLQKEIKSMGLSGVGLNMLKALDSKPGAVNPNLAKSGSSEAIDAAIDETQDAIVANVEDPKAREIASIKEGLEKKYQENMNSEFEIDDISTKKSDSIFEQISKRYFNKFRAE